MLNTEWVRRLNHTERWLVATRGTTEQIAEILKVGLPIPESFRLCARYSLEHGDVAYLLVDEAKRQRVASGEEMHATLLRVT